MAQSKTASGRQGAPDETRLQMRISPAKKDVLERAAAARGMSLTDFVLSTSLPEAERTLADQTFFTLGEEAWRQFNGFLDREPKDNPRLRAQLEKVKESKWAHLIPQRFSSSS